MILDQHPDHPKSRLQQPPYTNREDLGDHWREAYTKGYKFIGYWHSVFFAADDITNGYDFDAYEARFGPSLMPFPTDFQDPTWSPSERARVVAYLRAGRVFESWRGSSGCRFRCGSDLGYRDFTDGTYVWPEGFAHYVEVHDVRPPEEFLDHVRRGQGADQVDAQQVPGVPR